MLRVQLIPRPQMHLTRVDSSLVLTTMQRASKRDCCLSYSSLFPPNHSAQTSSLIHPHVGIPLAKPPFSFTFVPLIRGDQTLGKRGPNSDFCWKIHPISYQFRPLHDQGGLRISTHSGHQLCMIILSTKGSISCLCLRKMHTAACHARICML